MRYSDGTDFKIDELLAFGNSVFGDELPEGGFAQLLPKLASGAVETKHYRVITEDEAGKKIAAMLVMLPLTLRILDQELNVRYIGLVSVSKAARGKGYMKLLMNRAIQEMKDEGCHMSILGGQRQRYGYFGYEPAGFEVHYTLTPTNVRHALRAVGIDGKSGISLERLEQGSAAAKEAYSMYCRRAYRVYREEKNFFENLCTWKGIPYEIRQAGVIAGYISVDGMDKNKGELIVNELDMAEHVDTLAVYKTCMEFFEKQGYRALKFSLPVFDEKNQELGKICENIEIVCNHSYLVLDYCRVLSAMLEWKSKLCALADGEMMLIIDGERLIISVHKGVPYVKRDLHNSYDDVVSVSMTAHEAVRRLLSPEGWLPVFGNVFPAGWFPLEIYVSGVDAC